MKRERGFGSESLWSTLIRPALRRGAALAVGAALLAMAAAPRAAQADDIAVNTFADVIDDEDGLCSLREAIIAANTDTESGVLPGECPAGDGDDTITLPGGTYTLTIAGSGEEAALTGDLDVTSGSTITIEGTGAASTIIQACTLSQIDAACTVTGIADRVFHVTLGGDLTLEDVTVQHGRAPAGDSGGGVYALGSLSVTRGVVTANFAPVGGGGILSAGPLTITRSTISDNTSGGDGGGIIASGGLTLLRSTISGNTASGEGGGIAKFGSTPVTIVNVTVSGNTAASGGGIYIFTGEEHTLDNVTIAGNIATGGGAGGFELGNGGGIFPTATLTNTIISGSTGPDCTIAALFSFTDVRSNLIEDGDCGHIENGDNGNITGVDPLLGALADNGGPTLTHLPNAGSPVIGAGNVVACAAAPVSGEDQRGMARPATGCDIGAFEVPKVSIADLALPEGDAGSSTFEFEVSLPGSLPDGAPNVTVDYATADGSATSPEDYTAVGPTTLTFEPGGASTQTAPVTVLGDTDLEVSEIFLVNLSNVSGGALADNQATGTILNDEAGPVGTILVTTAADVIDGNDGLCSLREAIISANTDTASGAAPGECAAGDGDDTITLLGDTYTLTIDGIFEDASLTGDLDVIDGSTITIEGAGAASTIIQACTVSQIDAACTDIGIVDRVFDVFWGGDLTLEDVTVQHGRSLDSGGGVSANGSLTVTRGVVTANFTSGSGGGILSPVPGTLTITESIISGNKADGEGGGINVSSGMTLLRSTISGNTANLGGGMFIFHQAVTIANVTVSGNTADAGGGGILIFDVPDHSLVNVTIAGNAAGSGAGGFQLGFGGSFPRATLMNTIISGSTGPDCEIVDNGTLTDGGSNLIEDGNCENLRGGIFDGINGSITGENPLLGPLADNGGPTLTHLPNAGSRAIGPGNDAACAAAPVSGEDQRGDTRPPANCDIGAVEAADAAPTISDVADQTISEDDNTGALAFTIADDQTPVGNLTVTASSDNVALVPNDPANLTLGGSDAVRTLTVTPAADAFGTATITITVEDGATNQTTDTFTLTVDLVADTPAVTDASTLEDTQTTDGLVLSRSAADGAEVTHFKITNIIGGTLFHNDGATAVTEGTFITFDEGNAGLKFTPGANSTADGSFDVQASLSAADAGLGGSTVSATISVMAVNDAPSFTKGADQTVDEDAGGQAVSGWATALSAGPPDESAQTLTFSLSTDNDDLFSAQPSVDPSTGSLTFTPAADANGSASITVTLSDDGGTANDGADTSAPQVFTITVNAVNDAPVITVPGAQAVDEDGSLVFSTAGGNAVGVHDVDAGGADVEVTLTATSTVTLATTDGLDFTTGDGTDDETMIFTGTLVAVNAAFDGMVYSPVPDAFGPGSLTIRVNDQGNTGQGVALTDEETIAITVNAVNDAPTISGIADQDILEDAATAALNFTIGDVETAADNLTVTATSSNTALVPNDAANLTLGGSGTGRTLTVTPAPDANGTATITVTVSDGDLETTDTFELTVTGVNDAPIVSVPGAQALDEDGALVFSVANGNAVTIADVDAGTADVEARLTATSTVTLATTAGLTFSDGDGTDDETMTFTGTVTAVNAALDGMIYSPPPDAFGPGSLTIHVDDRGNTGLGVALQDEAVIPITIDPVNDPPTISTIPPQEILEDGSTSRLTVTIGDVETDAADLVVTAASDDENLVPNHAHYLTLGGSGPDRTLVVTPRNDANGRVRITITVDDGTDTAKEIVLVDITPVNDPPSFDPGSDHTAQKDGGPQTAPQWATTIRPGPANEGDQAVEFVVTNDNESLFAAQPAISPEGELTYTPAPGATGSADVDVRLRDDGGTENGGNDTSRRIAFTISVVDVNDAPTISEIGEVTLLEDTSVEVGFIVGDPETAPADLTVTSASDNAALLNEAGLVPGGSGAERTLTIRPLPDANGEATVTLTVSDGALEASTSFRVIVVPVNDAPVLDAAVGFALPDVLEDDPSPEGMLVGELLAGAVTDVDHGDPQGIAVIGTNGESGTWQYALDGASTNASAPLENGTSTGDGASSATTTSAATWIDVGAISESAALLLPAEASIRFVPNADVNGTMAEAIAFVAWDQSMGASGEAADATTRGGTAAFSAVAAAASIHIIPVADPPDLELLVVAEPPRARLGGTVMYSLMYHVLGVHGASGVILVATPPPGTFFVPELSDGGWEARGDGAYAFALGDLDGGADGSVPFAVEIAPDHPTVLVLLEAEIGEDGSTGGDSNPENNRAAHQLFVEVADLSLDLAIDLPSAARGETVTATARLANAGPDAATNVIVAFELPEGIELVEAEGFNPEAMGWNIAELAVDGAAEISAVIRIRSDAADHLEAAARIAFAEQIDPTPDDRSAAAALDVVDAPPPPPDLTGPGVVPFDGAQNVDLNVTLNWPDVPNADRYRLLLTDSTGTSKTGIVVDVDTLTAPSFAPGNLQPMHVYAWRIASISEGGQGPWSATITFQTRATSVSTERYGADLPDRFALQPNYPNPFNPATTVPFDVPEQADVRLEVYNVLGQHIAVLASGPTAPGRYRMTWQADDQPSGIYLVRMQAGSFTAVRRLLLIK